MFYFQQLFNTAMGGIDSGGATAGAVQVAQYILLASLLFGVYESWARGGDTHFLGATAVRFFAVGLVMINYGAAFRDVNGMFNNVANFINTSTAGGGDVFGQWMSDLSNYWNNNNGIQALWGLITGAFSGVLESLLLLVGYILFPITYALFSLFYTLYGSILYVVGPFVLALYPALGFGVMARKYLVNLMIFNAWGLIYSIFGALMAAINMNSVNTVLNSGNFVGAFNGVTGSLLLGLASILLSLCIALIPFLAKRVVEGDVGQTMISVISTSMIAARGAGSAVQGRWRWRQMRTHESRPEAEMASVTDRQNMPEKTRYTRYYEHDGMLRAYANRSMVLAMVFGAIALSSLAFAVYVRLQPPTVIRVDSEGDATVVAGTPVPGHSRGLNFVASAAEAAPTDVEAKAVVRRFLDRYFNLTPATVDRQMADALNMMTGNFKALVLGRLREDDTINKIQDDHIVTNFTIRTIAVVQGSPLTFTAFGVKEIHRLKNNQETTDQIVGRYNVRLALDRRTEYNPSGLLVADYWEQQMVGDKNTGLSQPDELSREATDKNR